MPAVAGRPLAALIVLVMLAGPARATTFVGVSERTLVRAADATDAQLALLSLVRPDDPGGGVAGCDLLGPPPSALQAAASTPTKITIRPVCLRVATRTTTAGFAENMRVHERKSTQEA